MTAYGKRLELVQSIKGVRLIVSDKCMGLVESIAEFYTQAQWQRFTVHWYRNVFSKVPRKKMREVAVMLKAIHPSEDKQAAREKALAVIEKLNISRKNFPNPIF